MASICNEAQDSSTFNVKLLGKINEGSNAQVLAAVRENPDDTKSSFKLKLTLTSDSFLSIPDHSIKFVLKCIMRVKNNIQQDDNVTLTSPINKQNSITTYTTQAELKNEIQIMHLISKTHICPFIIKYYFSCPIQERMYIGMEYAEGVDLFNLTKEYGCLHIPEAKFYLLEIISGIKYLHEAGIMHCDIKPENIVLTRKGHVRIIDYGLAVDFRKDGILNKENGIYEIVSHAGTLPYCPPEVILRKSHGPGSDWWSVGILLFELIFGCLPWRDEDPQELMLGIVTKNLEFVDDNGEDFELETDQSVKNFIEELLKKELPNRLGYTQGFEAINTHEFFENVDWDEVNLQKLEPPFSI